MERNYEKILLNIRNELIQRGVDCGDLEYTSGNYTNEGKEILEEIPTIICELGEIGLTGNFMYLTIIFPKDSLSQKLLDIVKGYENLSVYPFINFLKTLYPSKTNSLEYIEKGLKEEKYFQANIEFEKYNQNTVEQVLLLKKILDEANIEYINQLTDTLNS